MSSSSITLLTLLILINLYISSIFSLGDNDGIVATSSIYAQETAFPSSSSVPSVPAQGIGVKITSPTVGQSVSAGGEGLQQQLQITGTSSDNSITECQVSVIVNNVKPYQPAKANGSGGINDYSSWSFFLNSSYTPIEEGPNNKITSRIICPPNLTKWYSVNVTGISFNASMLKITSPTSYQEISTGKFTIQGTSVDDYYKDCEVFVRKNSLPFQKAVPAGLTGHRDFSVWRFTSTDDYASITPGNTNTLTARLSCGENQNILTDSTKTTYATVNIIGVNQPPVAEAKSDKEETREGEEVTLTAEESTDPNGDTLTYLWKQTGGLDEKVNLINANEAIANFRVPANLRDDTTFELTLTVTDRYGETATDTVEISAKANSEPVADAGSNKDAVIREQVTLDGSDSHDADPNGKITSYTWEQTDGPNVSLQGSNQPVARFSVPRVQEDTTFEFRLTVMDDEGAKDDDSTEVQVDAPPQPQLPDESGEVCFDQIDNNGNGLVDEECEFD
jgi:hypothetical protein